MIQSKREYLNKLKQEIGTSNSQEILKEIDLHLSEVLDDIYYRENICERDAMPYLIDRVGPPEELGAMYQQELRVTPVKTQWTFMMINLLFFVVGIALTAFYHLLSFPAVNNVWYFLTSVTSLIMVLYMVFWGLLGYEIGKEFGLSGTKLLIKTFYFSLLPNLILMGLVIFNFIPHSWFDPLLTRNFIITCILATLLLYPISYTGFRWGVKKSV
ncbi:hypothetical protein ACM26V_06805 [Salipaludibacillus sp. HK11]|uniref:hypothetical protein n=1 Tax=Salipaludibacillus sp. HK11 TaxID=3394320 RepID=UPI0039FCE86D